MVLYLYLIQYKLKNNDRFKFSGNLGGSKIKIK